MPVFDGEAYLAQALDSVLAQKHRPLEVVVVDDASRDGSARLAESYGDPVRVVRLSTQHGPGGACNAGVEASAGGFVGFQDADDLWYPQKLELQLGRFAARPELDCCLSHLQNFVSPEYEDAHGVDPELLRPMPGWSTPTLLARRSAMDRVGPFEIGLRHTYKTHWFVRARELGLNLEMLPDVLVQRRLHLDNMSSQEMSSSHDEHLALVKALLDRRRAEERGS